jgi:hypothetical protein
MTNATANTLINGKPVQSVDKATMLEDILKRLVGAIDWNDSGDAVIYQDHLKLLNEAHAAVGAEPVFISAKGFGEDDKLNGIPRGEGESYGDYIEHADTVLAQDHAAITKALAAQKESPMVDVYVNVEATVPQSRLECKDLNITGTYRVQVPGNLQTSDQAGIAMDRFNEKVGITEPAHFEVQVIKVLKASEAYVPGSLRDLGEFKGAHCFHPSLTPVARKP